MEINVDKVTSIAGITAAVCGGIIGTGVLVPATTAYIAIVAVGSLSASVWAYFTNKKPEDVFKKP